MVPTLVRTSIGSMPVGASANTRHSLTATPAYGSAPVPGPAALSTRRRRVVVTGSKFVRFVAARAMPYWSAPVTSIHVVPFQYCAFQALGMLTPAPEAGLVWSAQNATSVLSTRTGVGQVYWIQRVAGRAPDHVPHRSVC